MNSLPLRQPSALFPIAMSLIALALVLGQAAIFGVTHEADEGTAAHIFQMLMVAQVPIVALFAIKWLPRLIAWLFPLLGSDDRENMTRIWQMVMPPPAFAGAKQLIREAIGGGWAELAQRIPTLE